MFDGNQYMSIPDATSLQWSSGDFSVFVAMEQTVALYDYAIVYAKWTDTSPLYTGVFLWANYPYTPWDGPAFTGYVARIDIDREAIGKGAYNDGAVRLVGLVRSGDNLTLRLDQTVLS